MTPADMLRAARERLSAPERWTRDAFARDEHGVSVSSVDPRACAWCSLGALRVAHGWSMDAEEAACVALEAAIGCEIDEWNDRATTTHAEVLAAFDRAIALAEAQ